MPLDHDIPTHLNVTDRPAFGLTTAQLLLLVGGALVSIGALRQPHLPLPLRFAESLAPLGLALTLIAVRPSGRSLIAWGCVAVQHLTSPRLWVWASARDASGLSASGAPRRPPHLGRLDDRPMRARTASSTTRRQSRYPASHTLPFVPWEIADDTVVFRDGHRCAVVECSGTETTLMGEEALRATHAAYHTFLVGLPRPLQILVWASPVDLRAHVAARERHLAALPLALRELESADIGFMRREASRLGLLDHRLFVVIPAPGYHERTVPTGSLLAAVRARHRRAPSVHSDNEVAAVIDERCERVTTGLAAAGVPAWRLSTEALRTLWYRLLVPRGAALQPFDPGHAAPAVQPEIMFRPLEEEENDA